MSKKCDNQRASCVDMLTSLGAGEMERFFNLMFRGDSAVNHCYKMLLGLSRIDVQLNGRRKLTEQQVTRCLEVLNCDPAMLQSVTRGENE